MNPTTPRRGNWQREELLHLLSVSGTLAGLCITGVALFHTLGRASLPETVADDLLAISALLFLVCTYTIFFALRTRREALALTLEKVADIMFLMAMTGMVGSGFVMVYTVL
jgi:multisubunit Na+/H+ antiporter MnhF subunit